MKFTIVRDKWICGEPMDNQMSGTARGRGFTALLNPQGFMCCLGQVSLQLGVSEKDIKHIGSPASSEALWGSILCRVEGTSYLNSILASTAMSINDSHTTSLSKKEELLTQLFAGSGHKLVFVDTQADLDNQSQELVITSKEYSPVSGEQCIKQPI